MTAANPKIPRVSVVIPTYNCAPYLPDALKSVFAQTLKHIEVIVVDDGSTDDTEAAITPWRQHIFYIPQKRGGVAAARNTGIATATAPYVAFLDADDRWMPEKLEKQLALLEGDESVALVCADFSISFGNGKTIHSFFHQSPPVDERDPFIRIVENCFIFPSTAMVRRNALLQIGMFDVTPGIAEDLHLWLRLARISRIAVVAEVLCAKRERLSSELLHPLQRFPESSKAQHVKLQGAGGRPYELTVGSEIGALEKVLVSFPELSAARRRALRRQIGKLRCDLASYLLTRDQPGRSREILRPVLTSSPLRAGVLLALTCFPRPLVHALRYFRGGVS